jgi:hypothetical protein
MNEGVAGWVDVRTYRVQPPSISPCLPFCIFPSVVAPLMPRAVIPSVSSHCFPFCLSFPVSLTSSVPLPLCVTCLSLSHPPLPFHLPHSLGCLFYSSFLVCVSSVFSLPVSSLYQHLSALCLHHSVPALYLFLHVSLSVSLPLCLSLSPLPFLPFCILTSVYAHYVSPFWFSPANSPLSSQCLSSLGFSALFLPSGLYPMFPL